MRGRLRSALLEVVGPVVPVALVVVFLQIVVIQLPSGLFLRFLAGVALVIVGLFLFLAGVNLGLMPLGEFIGSHLPLRVRPPVLIGLVILLGFFATVAEPDVRVLSQTVGDQSAGTIGNLALVLTVAAGLGLALGTAVVRQLARLRFALLVTIGYGLILLLALFAPPVFLAIALDSGAVTTGPLTVPLIMAVGMGVARTFAGKSSVEGGFGLIGIASMGPVILLLIMGIIV